MSDHNLMPQLAAQAEVRRADSATLRALAEETSESGARRALERLGLADERTLSDMVESRELLSE